MRQGIEACRLKATFLLEKKPPASVLEEASFKRVFEHKNGAAPGFTRKYSLHKLLYYEVFENIEDAIKREKQLKNWHREWKLNLIRPRNPEFRDLYPDIV